MLKGTTLDVYRFLLKQNKPMGVREIQRALNLSSPSVATYHLAKLEETGLLKRVNGAYSVDKLLLEYSVKVSRFLIPRFLFYAIFALAVLLIELTVMKPPIVTQWYAFSIIASIIFVVVFWYEAVKTWRRGTL